MLKTLGLSEQNVDIIPNEKRNKLERSISKITALGENMLDVSVTEAEVEKVFAVKMEENKILHSICQTSEKHMQLVKERVKENMLRTGQTVSSGSRVSDKINIR